VEILDVKAVIAVMAVGGRTAMYFDAFDPDLLRVHGDLLAADLRNTMAAGRRAAGVAVARRWLGERLVRAGESLASDASVHGVARSVQAGQHAR
jgi:hypothetical protein